MWSAGEATVVLVAVCVCIGKRPLCFKTDKLSVVPTDRRSETTPAARARPEDDSSDKCCLLVTTAQTMTRICIGCCGRTTLFKTHSLLPPQLCTRVAQRTSPLQAPDEDSIMKSNSAHLASLEEAQPNSLTDLYHSPSPAIDTDQGVHHVREPLGGKTL
jgi:hypothetical protein